MNGDHFSKLEVVFYFFIYSVNEEINGLGCSKIGTYTTLDPNFTFVLGQSEDKKATWGGESFYKEDSGQDFH